jgi:hypothetical protein
MKMIFCLLILVPLFTIGQTESSTHIFWQSSDPLELRDYQGKPPRGAEVFCAMKGLCVVASTGIFTALDLPKKGNSGLPELLYIAPAFEKTTSYAITNDTIGLKYQQLIFDVEELMVRKLRMRLFSWRDSMATNLNVNPEDMTGVFGSLLMTMKAEVEQEAKEFVKHITRDLYIEPKDSAYIDWKHTIENELTKYSEWQTTPKDCLRFVVNEPIERHYKQAKRLTPNLFPKV